MKTVLTTVCALIAVTACASPQEPQQSLIAVETLTFGVGGTVDIMVISPDTPIVDAPVIVAFPWGGGDRGLTGGLLSTYWDQQAPARGYIVVGIVTSTVDLQAEADAVMQAVSDYLDSNFSHDRDRLIFTGASAGGRNLFFASLAMPDRIAGILAMPGQWTGDTNDLAPLSGKSIRLMVGENDSGWRDGTDATADALTTHGASVQVDVLAGQGHVLAVSQSDLVDWIDGVLGR